MQVLTLVSIDNRIEVIVHRNLRLQRGLKRKEHIEKWVMFNYQHSSFNEINTNWYFVDFIWKLFCKVFRKNAANYKL